MKHNDSCDVIENAFYCNSDSGCHIVNPVDVYIKDNSYHCPLHVSSTVKLNSISIPSTEFHSDLISVVFNLSQEIVYILEKKWEYNGSITFCGIVIDYMIDNPETFGNDTFESTIAKINGVTKQKNNWSHMSTYSQHFYKYACDSGTISYSGFNIPFIQYNNKEITTIMESGEYLYHGTSFKACMSILKYGIQLSGDTNHFGYGFYMTDDLDYANKWAYKRKNDLKSSVPIVIMVFSKQNKHMIEGKYNVFNSLENGESIEIYNACKNKDFDKLRAFKSSHIFNGRMLKDIKNIPIQEQYGYQRVYRKNDDVLLDELLNSLKMVIEIKND